MNDKVKQDGAPSVESEGIFSMYEEVVEEIASMKRRPPSSTQEITFVILRTIMPLIRDLAYYVREDRIEIDGLIDRDSGSMETQFTPEDAMKFELITQFAKQQAEVVLTALQDQPEQKAQIEAVLVAANECLAILESSTLDDEEDEEEQPEAAAQEPS